MQSVCDVLNEVSKSDSDASGVQAVQPVLKCLHSILGAPILPPTLHKFEIVVNHRNTAKQVHLNHSLDLTPPY